MIPTRLARLILVAASFSIWAIQVVWSLPAQPKSFRSTEIVRRECKTSFGEHEVTLFANGTLRLRQTESGEDSMKLAELSPDEVRAFDNRLRDEDLSEVEPGSRTGMTGDLVEICEIHLGLDDEVATYGFGRFDSLPLSLSRLNIVIDDMLLLIQQRAPTFGLPPSYSPRRGDILVRGDGALFHVVGLTSNKKGVELRGVDEPLTLFVALESLHESFISVKEISEWP